jgi:hypothetical protein
MRGHRASSRRIAGLVLVLLACAGCYTTARRAPNFEKRRARIRSVAVIPPDVEVIEHAFKGSGRRLREAEDQVRLNVALMTARLLTERGVAAKQASLEESALKEKPDLRFKLTQMQTAFAREMGKAYQHETMRRSKAFKSEHTLGPSVNVFADRDQVDGLVFVRVRGVRQSEGQRSFVLFTDTLFAVATGVWQDPGSGEAAIVQIGLVDGTTGDVLWSDMGRTLDLNGMSTQRAIKQMIKGMTPGTKTKEEKEVR